MILGAHVSTKGGPAGGLDEADRLGAEVIQIFVGSPRTWALKPRGKADGEKLQDRRATSPGVKSIAVHASYLINLASSDPTLYEKSIELCLATLESASNLGCEAVVLHTGSHRGLGYEQSRPQLKRSFERCIELLVSHDTPTKLLLENTAGAGGTVGASLEELADLLTLVGAPDHLGICLDTQHLFAYGYDLRDPAVRSQTSEHIASLFGWVDAVHLNDSLTSCGDKHDRHANLDEGEIGGANLASFLAHNVFDRSSVILEVPGDGDGPRPSDVTRAREFLGGNF